MRRACRVLPVPAAALSAAGTCNAGAVQRSRPIAIYIRNNVRQRTERRWCGADHRRLLRRLCVVSIHLHQLPTTRHVASCCNAEHYVATCSRRGALRPATWHLHAQLLACIELAALQLELGQCEHRLLVRLLRSRREQVCVCAHAAFVSVAEARSTGTQPAQAPPKSSGDSHRACSSCGGWRSLARAAGRYDRAVRAMTVT